MVGRRTQFTSELAPCGRTVDGEHYRDEDDYGLIIYDQLYACGCRRIRHEFHDGSIDTKAIRHDGKAVRDFGPDHGA